MYSMPYGNPFIKAEGVTPVTDTSADRCDLLERTRWSDAFTYRQITVFAKYMQTFEASKASVLFREGDHSSFLCVIVKGRVGVVKHDSRNGVKHLATVGAGSTFGEIALVDEAPRSATVVTDEATTLLVLTHEAFDALTLDVPQLALALMCFIARLMSQRLRRTSGVLSDYLETITPKEK